MESSLFSHAELCAKGTIPLASVLGTCKGKQGFEIELTSPGTHLCPEQRPVLHVTVEDKKFRKNPWIFALDYDVARDEGTASI
jgi:hypothetical protein